MYFFFKYENFWIFYVEKCHFYLDHGNLLLAMYLKKTRKRKKMLKLYFLLDNTKR